MTRSRTISISVKRKIGDTFDAILNYHTKMMSTVNLTSEDWWLFSIPRGTTKLKFQDDDSLGILDHVFIDNDSKWNIPIRVVSSGDESEVIITLIKPDEITDVKFDERMGEIERVFVNMKKIIESNL